MKELKILYSYYNKTLKEYILEVKRLDVIEKNTNKPLWCQTMIHNGKIYVHIFVFQDMGKLLSGKEIRILKNDHISDGDGPWIFIFDKYELEMHRTEWDPDAGKFIAVKKDDVPINVLKRVMKAIKKKYPKIK